MTARKGQVASLDLVLSFIIFILFIALIIVYILSITGTQPVRYGEGLLQGIDFVEDRILDRDSIPDDDDAEAFGEKLFSESQYPETSDYCITLDFDGDREALIGTECAGGGTPCSDSQSLDRYAKNVLDGTRIKQLTLWVCT